MKRLCLLVLAAAVSACSDGPSGPVPVASVSIVTGATIIDEHTLEIGETVQLSANLFDAAGNALVGRDVTWTSTLESVATVSQTGLVTAVSVGETLVTASAEGVSDQVIIKVVAPPATDLVCADGDAGISLAVGQVHTVSAVGSPVICLAGGTSGSEYTLVPFNAAPPADQLQVEVAGNGLIAAAGPPSPARFLDLATAAGVSVPPLREDIRFHARLRARERQQLGHLARGGGAGMRQFSRSAAPGAGASAAVAAVGDLIRFNVDAEHGCTNPRYRWARVMAVSTRAVVVADTLNPSGGFTQAEYAQFAATFDTLVYPTVTGNFGTPRDVDDNGGRSVILFTGAVNELTPANSPSFVGGFFFSRDLFPVVANDSMGACPASNQAEMFYMLVPDPNGEINSNKRSKEFVAERTVGVLAHEFQHLINASRRLFIVKAGGQKWIEEVWLNEGLSHIAEELTFYAATPHEPKQNINIENLRASQLVFDRWVQYKWSNFARFIEYMKNASRQSLMSSDTKDDDLETRGATWAFLRYMADRHGGAEPALWKSLVDTDRQGLANVNAVLGNDALGWMRDWTVSVYTDDAVPTTAVYQMPSWNFRSIILGLKSASTGSPLFTTYPLEVLPLLEGEQNKRSLTLQGGGAGYLRFGIAGGQRAALRAQSGGTSAPARLMISIVRTK